MVSWLECNANFAGMVMMDLLERKHISMVLHLQTSELRLGGLISGEVEQAGGSTFIRTWLMLEYWT